MGRSGSTSSTNSRSRSDEKNRGRTSKKAKRGKKEARHRRVGRGSGSPDTASDGLLPGGAAGSADAVAASPLALPTDNSVLSIDFVNSLATSINALTTNMKEVQLGMVALQRESREQRGQIATIVGELQSMRTLVQKTNQKYEDDMNSLNKDINEKLAKLQADTTKLGAAPPAPPSSSYAAAASRAASSSGGGPAVGSHRPTRIWIKGFGEVLTTRFLNEFAQGAVDKLPPDLRAGAKTGAPGFGPSVYIDFPPDSRIAVVKDALAKLSLKHTDEGGKVHSLRISSDLPLAVRHKARVLGELWKLVEAHLSSHPSCSSLSGFKLGNSNGKLFLITGPRPLELFSTSADDHGTLHINPNLANLNKFEISEPMARSWATSAACSAARPGQ
jgi:hypothetical protein